MSAHTSSHVARPDTRPGESSSAPRLSRLEAARRTSPCPHPPPLPRQGPSVTPPCSTEDVVAKAAAERLGCSARRLTSTGNPGRQKRGTGGAVQTHKPPCGPPTPGPPSPGSLSLEVLRAEGTSWVIAGWARLPVCGARPSIPASPSLTLTLTALNSYFPVSASLLQPIFRETLAKTDP